MQNFKLIYCLVAILIGASSISSCTDDFLTASSTEKQEAGAPATEGAIQSNLTAAYQILLFDSYASGSYNSIVLMSDLRSDDFYKGGGNAGDQEQLYKLSQFTSTGASTLNGLWSIYYMGLTRCNNVLIACDNAIGVEQNKLDKIRAEAHFLRGYYVHLLWKFYGNIPYFEEPLTSPYMAKQLPADSIYMKIIKDVDYACAEGLLPMKATGSDLGRASRAAALMLRARVVLYQKDESRYPQITNDMATIIKSGQYALLPDFDAMWRDENEFCIESIFESNQLPEGRVYNNPWVGYGTNLPKFISPNSLRDPSKVFIGGWAFGPVRQSAYDMYENGDKRRDGSINKWPAGTYNPRFQDTGLFLRKYAAREGYNPPPGVVDLNFSNNLRIFRYAETLLNYVELVKMHGQSEVQGVSAQNCLNDIRTRAGIGSISATPENIKLERRREFLGEGMRFWDLVRWGDATTVLTENDPLHNSVRTFEDWMKYIPIPSTEIEKTKGTEFELKQNGNWQ